MKNRLYKSTKEKMLFGVCGGVAEYFDIDPTIVRVVTVISSMMTAGFVFLAYIVMAICMPIKPNEGGSSSQESNSQREYSSTDNQSTNVKKTDSGLIVGLSLVAFGTIFLVQKWIPSFHIPFDILVPIVLIGIGAVILVKHRGENDDK